MLLRFAAPTVLAPKLGKLHKEFPEIVPDVTTDNNRRDIVAEDFDAGIHFGEFIEKDMIAVRVSPDQRPAIIGSPDYFKTHPKTQTTSRSPAAQGGSSLSTVMSLKVTNLDVLRIVVSIGGTQVTR